MDLLRVIRGFKLINQYGNSRYPLYASFILNSETISFEEPSPLLELREDARPEDINMDLKVLNLGELFE